MLFSCQSESGKEWIFITFVQLAHPGRDLRNELSKNSASLGQRSRVSDYNLRIEQGVLRRWRSMVGDRNCKKEKKFPPPFEGP